MPSELNLPVVTGAEVAPTQVVEPCHWSGEAEEPTDVVKQLGISRKLVEPELWTRASPQACGCAEFGNSDKSEKF